MGLMLNHWQVWGFRWLAPRLVSLFLFGLVFGATVCRAENKKVACAALIMNRGMAEVQLEVLQVWATTIQSGIEEYRTANLTLAHSAWGMGRKFHRDRIRELEAKQKTEQQKKDLNEKGQQFFQALIQLANDLMVWEDENFSHMTPSQFLEWEGQIGELEIAINDSLAMYDRYADRFRNGGLEDERDEARRAVSVRQFEKTRHWFNLFSASVDPNYVLPDVHPNIAFYGHSQSAVSPLGEHGEFRHSVFSHNGTSAIALNTGPSSYTSVMNLLTKQLVPAVTVPREKRRQLGSRDISDFTFTKDQRPYFEIQFVPVGGASVPSHEMRVLRGGVRLRGFPLADQTFAAEFRSCDILSVAQAKAPDGLESLYVLTLERDSSFHSEFNFSSNRLTLRQLTPEGGLISTVRMSRHLNFRESTAVLMGQEGHELVIAGMTSIFPYQNLIFRRASDLLLLRQINFVGEEIAVSHDVTSRPLVTFVLQSPQTSPRATLIARIRNNLFCFFQAKY